MRTFASFLIATFLIVQVGGCKPGDRSSSGRIPSDAKMLNLTLMDVDGEQIDLRQFYGKVVILDFWDTWCAPCRREVPSFAQLYSEYKDKGFVMVGVAFARRGNKAVKDFARQYGMNYPNTIFNQGAARLYGAPPAIPTTYIINQQGEIHKKVVGYHDKAFFEREIRQLLGS